MPRTLNPAAHALRRDAFVDVAQRLIATKGYEELSIQDVLDEAGSSKGAFYHYFDSKEALLAAVVDRITEAALAATTPIVCDETLPAVRKFERFFGGIAQWKNARKDLMLGLIGVWLSDSNTIVREQVRRSAIARITPVLAEIVREGQADGSFHVNSVEHAAEVLIALILGLQEFAIRAFMARQARQITFEDAMSTFLAYQEALDRILGVPDGTFQFLDDETAHLWFD